MVLYILLFVAIVLAGTGLFLSKTILYITLKTQDKILEFETTNHHFDKKCFDALKKEQVQIRSPYGYQLAGFFIPCDNKTGNTVIFCHGVTVSHLSSMKYARMFYRRGWNVFIYDHRRHGGSGGQMTSYGYYEKHDLKAVVDYLKSRLNHNAMLGLHGESMGAATVLQYGGMNDNVDFYIADCSYSSFWGQLCHLLKTRYHLPIFPFVHLADIFVRLSGKFRLKDINPLEDIRKIKNPVLLIHGDEDTYVPTKMSVEMFEAKPGVKELYLVPEAAHAQSFRVNPEKYETTVFTFLQQAGIDISTE